jgi:hypothetical protein
MQNGVVLAGEKWDYILFFGFCDGGLTMLSRLILNLWAQVIFQSQPSK